MKPQRISLMGRATRAGGGALLGAAMVVLSGCSGSLDQPASEEGAQEPATGPELPPGSTVRDDGTVVNADGTPILNPDGTPVTAPVAAPGATNPDGTPAQVPDAPAEAGPGPLGETPPPSECEPGVPGTSQLPRLTKVQYDNTIRDLVGLESEPSALLAPDTTGSVDQRAWDGYQAAAEAVAQQIMADANARARAITCTPSGDGTECMQQFIGEFGARAFRRPLTEAEVAKFTDLWNRRAEITETGSFDEVAQVMLRAFLVSPSFLTRAETSETLDGDRYALNGYEIATRLSYLLWASMPDDVLFAAAAANALSTPEQILEQANRMLADDRAREQVAGFHRQYAHMGPGTRWLDGISRDPGVFPTWNEAIVPLMNDETERLFDHITFDLVGSFQDLLLSRKAFVNASTAPFYGLDAASFGNDLEETDLDSARPGIFTRLGFLVSHSRFDASSPILRGAFLQKEVLCTEIPPPPPGAAGAVLPTDGLTTNRERVDAQTAGADCVTCHHTVVNPTGFAMESFDAIGRVQTTDNGAPIDSNAVVPMGTIAVTVSGHVDMMNAIAASYAAQHCYAEKWVQYAYEREPNAADACVVEQMVAEMRDATTPYAVLDLIADLTQSDSFRYRALEAEVVQ